MDSFGYKKGRILLVMAVICLFGFIVWQFLLGGRSTIQTEFLPINGQMQAVITRTTEQPVPKATLPPGTAAQPAIMPESKPSLPPETSHTTTPDSKLTIATDTKPRIKPEANSTVSLDVNRLDLNTATLEQLDELPGIGESKARAILEYRIKKGRFSRIDELMEVKGIGEKMLEKLKALLYVTTS